MSRSLQGAAAVVLGLVSACGAGAPASVTQARATSARTGSQASAVVAVASVPVVASSAPTIAPAMPSASAVAAKPKIELPRGGRTLFPNYRLVGFCGTPGGPALGPLSGKLEEKTKKLIGFAEKYSADRPYLPVFELIAVVVQSYPGTDGKYRRRVPDSVIDEYLALARAQKGLLLLNIQPGQSDFMSEVTRLERYLKEPDVGIALDPEWSVKAKQTPGVFYGRTSGAIINEVGGYLSKLVKDGDLPEKVLVFHQLMRFVVKDEEVVAPTEGVVFIKSVDGLGPKRSKLVTYANLMKVMTKGVHPGFKLFFDEDTRNGAKLMTPDEVLGLTPRPEYVMYE